MEEDVREVGGGAGVGRASPSGPPGRRCSVVVPPERLVDVPGGVGVRGHERLRRCRTGRTSRPERSRRRRPPSGPAAGRPVGHQRRGAARALVQVLGGVGVGRDEALGGAEEDPRAVRRGRREGRAEVAVAAVRPGRDARSWRRRCARRCPCAVSVSSPRRSCSLVWKNTRVPSADAPRHWLLNRAVAPGRGRSRPASVVLWFAPRDRAARSQQSAARGQRPGLEPRQFSPKADRRPRRHY